MTSRTPADTGRRSVSPQDAMRRSWARLEAANHKLAQANARLAATHALMETCRAELDRTPRHHGGKPAS